MPKVADSSVGSYFKTISDALDAAKKDNQLFMSIVEAPFEERRRTTDLGLGFITFLLYNKKTGNIDRILKTENELGKLGSEISVKPFSMIKVPLSHKGNIIAEAIRSGQRKQTTDWANILSPDLSPDESRLNQANSGISCSFVHPLKSRNGGALIFHYFVTIDNISPEHLNFMSRYTKIVDSALNTD